jgi:hypothetical protein
MEMISKFIRFSILAVLAAVLVMTFTDPASMISPGKLSPGHVGLAENCFACHQLFRGVTPEKCESCHKIGGEGLITTKDAAPRDNRRLTPFHHALIQKNCSACHVDHEGMKVYGAMIGFSHNLLQPNVGERCGSCHQKPEDSLHQKVIGECSSCHAQKKWKPATFDHSKAFELDSNHNVACVTCHKDNDFKKYTCYGCHEHSRNGIAAIHRKEGVSNFDNCVACHRSAREEHEKGDDEI